MLFQIPILFLIFKRLDTTLSVFEQIRAIRPAQLFIAADGARPYKKGEHSICEKVRKEVMNRIDWNCEVKTLFRNENLGCRLAVSGAINWFFEQVEQGIILEDDCLPHLSFFNYCAELLEKYKDNEQIMHISGCNLDDSTKHTEYSYFYSHHVNIWGWATWRRAWKHYDLQMSCFPAFVKQNGIYSVIPDKKLAKQYMRILERVYHNPTTWDYQWAFSVIAQKGYAITPATNLISNIGFGKASTHAYDTNSPLANLPIGNILPIKHPENISIQEEADLYFLNKTTKMPALSWRIKNKLLHLFKFK